MLRLNTNKRLCPHLQEPFDDCYCVKMSSQDIERAVYLCSNNFETCDIFKNGNGNGHKKPSINERAQNSLSL
jgi:hypothetical protein